MRKLLLPLLSFSVISLYAVDNTKESGIDQLIRDLSPKNQTQVPNPATSETTQFKVIGKAPSADTSSSSTQTNQNTLSTEKDHIIDLSKGDQVIKLKILNAEHENFQVAYIVEFNHRATSDFDVYILFLDKDGFEILWRFLGTGAIDPNMQASRLGKVVVEPRYDLKGTFSLPQDVFKKISTAELHFYQSNASKPAITK